MKPCAECGKPVDLKPGDKITTEIGVMELNPNEEPTLCRACMSTGWAEVTPEDFENDPSFRVGHISPIQRHDLL